MAWIIIIVITFLLIKFIMKRQYRKLEAAVLTELGFDNWDIIPYFDEFVTVKSRQALEKYDDIKFFKENREMLEKAENIIKRKNENATILKKFLENNEYKSCSQYNRIAKYIRKIQVRSFFAHG